MIKLDISGYTEREVLEYMLIGLERHRDAIVEKVRSLQAQVGTVNGLQALQGVLQKEWHLQKEAAPVPKVKSRMSAAGRKAIAEAQRKRWRKHHREAAKVAKKAPRGKRPRKIVLVDVEETLPPTEV